MLKIPIETSLPAFCPPNKLWLLDPDDICSEAISKWTEINLQEKHAEATWIWRKLSSLSPLTYVVQGRTVIELWMCAEKQGFSTCKLRPTSVLPRIAPGKYSPFFKSNFQKRIKHWESSQQKQENEIQWVIKLRPCSHPEAGLVLRH